MMDINQIQELIRLVSKSKVTEFILKEGDFKLIIRNQAGAETTAAPVVAFPPPQQMMTMTTPAPPPPAPVS
ncbi:MAG: hypothetical protein ABMA02_11180, partial [Saprospiraceae bacterium]